MAPATDTLPQHFSHVPCASFAERNELTAIVIDNSHACAEILLQGAQLIAYAPHGERPLIWNSPLAGFRKGVSSRGGIPVCWPWFGDATRNPAAVQAQLGGDKLPAHGFVRSIDWQLDDVRALPDGSTRVVLSLLVSTATHPAWPFSAHLVVTHHVGRDLVTSFDVENRDQRAFQFSSALHTYFAVCDIDSMCIGGFDGCSYIDALDDWNVKIQQGDVTIDCEVDRIYLDTPARSVIHDAGWQRDIVIDTQGSRNAVVWNPWVEKSKRLSDFASDAYRNMLCIETANVMGDVIILAPGEKHMTSVRVAQRSLTNG